MLALKFLFTLVIAIVIVFFLVINGHSVNMNYYNQHFDFMTVSFPLSMILVASILTGFLSAWIFGVIEQIKLKGTIRKQGKRLKEMEKKIEDQAFQVSNEPIINDDNTDNIDTNDNDKDKNLSEESSDIVPFSP